MHPLQSLILQKEIITSGTTCKRQQPPSCMHPRPGSITYQPASQPANQTSTSTVHPKPPFNCMLKAIILAGILLRIVLFLTPAHIILQSRPELSTPLTSWRSC